MHPRGEGVDGGGFLPATLCSRANEEAEVLAVEGALLPEGAETVDEGLPLCGVVAVAGGDAKEVGVVFSHVIGGYHGDGGVFWGGVLGGC